MTNINKTAPTNALGIKKARVIKLSAAPNNEKIESIAVLVRTSLAPFAFWSHLYQSCNYRFSYFKPQEVTVASFGSFPVWIFRDNGVNSYCFENNHNGKQLLGKQGFFSLKKTNKQVPDVPLNQQKIDFDDEEMDEEIDVDFSTDLAFQYRQNYIKKIQSNAVDLQGKIDYVFVFNSDDFDIIRALFERFHKLDFLRYQVVFMSELENGDVFDSDYCLFRDQVSEELVENIQKINRQNS